MLDRLAGTLRTFSGSNRNKIRTSNLSLKIRCSYAKKRVYSFCRNRSDNELTLDTSAFSVTLLHNSTDTTKFSYSLFRSLRNIGKQSTIIAKEGDLLMCLSPQKILSARQPTIFEFSRMDWIYHEMEANEGNSFHTQIYVPALAPISC